jgi:hypothetical protein
MVRFVPRDDNWLQSCTIYDRSGHTDSVIRNDGPDDRRWRPSLRLYVTGSIPSPRGVVVDDIATLPSLRISVIRDRVGHRDRKAPKIKAARITAL